MRDWICVAKAALIAVLLSAWGIGAADARIDIYIDKSSQLMSVSVNGLHRYTWRVSTGKAGYATPSGTFQPFRMEPDHFSREWDNAPMPYSIFFTYQGHAIHGSPHTRGLGRAVSHGCVRLAPRDAATLYSLVGRQGMGKTRIVIADGGTVSAAAPVKRHVAPKKAPRTLLERLRDRRR